MPSAVRGVIWSLLTAIIILLLGLMGLLYISYNRDRQYASEIQYLRHKIAEKDAQIKQMKPQNGQSVTPSDTIPTAPSPSDF
ncbi:MAG: hypothetical protein LH609_07565 [Rudanella sp.]|nr:hypothetical protein [Rudanella sp.]